MSRQLRLFPPARPLQEQFGTEFFRSIPKCPGVYLMQDSTGKIIYVGKAKNLRNRIGSYRYVCAERASRKSVRLVHTVKKIEWEPCESDLAAQLRENFLLRTHRPKFNVINVFPKAYCFVGSRVTETSWELCFTREERNDFHLFGSFKPGARVAFHALLRLIWSMTAAEFRLDHVPNGLLGTNVPRSYIFAAAPIDLIDAVHSYLEGEHTDLLIAFDKKRLEWPLLSTFETHLLDSDRETLALFFERVTNRNRSMKTKFGVPGRLIPQETLNDLLVQDRSERKSAAHPSQ